MTAPTETLKLEVTYLLDKKNFALSKNFYTVDQVVMEIVDRFAMKHFESKQFDFGDGVVVENLPEHEDIEKVVRNAMQKANFKEDKLSEDNRKQVDLFFNQFLPKGKKKVVHVKIDGNLQGIKTETMAASSARTGELDKYVTVFISEDYENELTGDNIFILEDIVKRFKKESTGQSLFEFEYTKSEYFRQLTVVKPVFVVNTSMFKTPQNLVIVSHAPESKFVFQLIDNAKLLLLGSSLGTWTSTALIMSSLREGRTGPGEALILISLLFWTLNIISREFIPKIPEQTLLSYMNYRTREKDDCPGC